MFHSRSWDPLHNKCTFSNGMKRARTRDNCEPTAQVCETDLSDVKAIHHDPALGRLYKAEE